MQFGSHIVRFDLRGIPVVGNTLTGTLVGLTPEGAALCDAMLIRDVDASEVSAECEELVDYLTTKGFTVREDNVNRLSSAYLHVSNKCNLTCVGCYSADCNRNHTVDPTVDELFHAISVLAELGVTRLVVSGGEPFMRADLPELMRHARKLGMEDILVLTNGTRCTDCALAALAPHVDTVAVSFDGVSAQSPAHVRGVQLFDRLVGCVAAIQRAGMNVHILPTIHARNVADIPKYVELGERLGATVGFSILSGSSPELGDLMLRETCLYELADVMAGLAAAGSTAVLGDVFNPAQGLTTCASCGAGRTSVSVAAVGAVYPCHMLHKPEFSLGNAFVDNAGSIKSRLALFSLPSVDEIEGCSLCEQRYLCGGGCRARAYDEYGGIGERDPYCAYYRRAIDHAVEMFLSQA